LDDDDDDDNNSKLGAVLLSKKFISSLGLAHVDQKQSSLTEYRRFQD